LSTLRQAHLEAPPMLPVDQQYRLAFASFPRLNEQQEQVLIERAYVGEDVRDDVVLSLQERVYTLAAKYLGRDKAIERMDLVDEASVAMLESFDRALTKENPFSYLLQVARNAMVDCVNGRSDLIKTREGHIPVLSLDQPNEEGDSLADTLAFEVHLEAHHPLESAFVSLCEAIEGLPEKQRMVIQRHYGFDSEAESLNLISRSLALRAKSGRPGTAHYHCKLAHATLRKQLTPLLPQYAVGGAL